MINALFVLIVFLLQLNKDNLHVKWPISARINVTYDEVTQEVTFYGTSRTCIAQRLSDVMIIGIFCKNSNFPSLGVSAICTYMNKECDDDAAM